LHERYPSQVSCGDKTREIAYDTAAKRHNKRIALESMGRELVVTCLNSLEALGSFACGHGQEKGSETGLFERARGTFSIERSHIPIGNDGAPAAQFQPRAFSAEVLEQSCAYLDLVTASPQGDVDDSHSRRIGFGAALSKISNGLTFSLLLPSTEIMLSPVNPVALITGASRGIGRGIALELAKAGYDLIINCASNIAAARKTAVDCVASTGKHGPKIRAEICQADIGVSAAREKLVEFTRSTFRRLDLLVNNAGVAPEVRADILEANEASFDRLININVKGPYFLTQLVARWMIQQAINGTSRAAVSPKIVTISSISAYTASTNRGDYCIAKAALSMLTPLYASRLAEFGIQVYEIRPGIISTDMTEGVKAKYDKLIGEGLTPIKRWGTPEDVGKAVAALAQGALPFSTGDVINVDGGFHLRRL
jgi:NAD(P)-dependent dehydrogenase (short-subunit alcohol dehydrogenase family)